MKVSKIVQAPILHHYYSHTLPNGVTQVVALGDNTKACLWSSDTEEWTFLDVISSSKEEGAPFFLNGNLYYYAGNDDGAVFMFNGDLNNPDFTQISNSVETLNKLDDELIKIDFEFI